MVQKFIIVVLAFVMIIFAGVQLNDPDPVIWIATYLSVAAVGIMKLFNFGNDWVNRILIGAFVVAIGFYVPDVFRWIQDGMPSVVNEMRAETPYVEYVREGGGLVFALFCLLYIVYR